MSRMRSHSVCASSMSCVLMTTAAPRSRCSSSRLLSIVALTGSRPWNGSSTMSRSGSLMIVAMSCAFWCMPRDSSPAFLVSVVAQPDLGQQLAWRAARRAAGDRPRSAPK